MGFSVNYAANLLITAGANGHNNASIIVSQGNHHFLGTLMHLFKICFKKIDKSEVSNGTNTNNPAESSTPISTESSGVKDPLQSGDPGTIIGLVVGVISAILVLILLV